MFAWFTSLLEEQTLDIAERRIAENVHNIYAWKMKVNILLGADRIKEAESALLTAVVLVPDNHFLRNWLSTISFVTGKFEQAKEYTTETHSCEESYENFQIYSQMTSVILHKPYHTSCAECTTIFNQRLLHFRKTDQPQKITRNLYLSKLNNKYENYGVARALFKAQRFDAIERYCVLNPSLIFLPLLTRNGKILSKVFSTENMKSNYTRITREIFEFGLGYYYAGFFRNALPVLNFGLWSFSPKQMDEKNPSRAYVKLCRTSLLYHRAGACFQLGYCKQAEKDLRAAKSIAGYLSIFKQDIRLKIEANQFGRSMRTTKALSDMCFLF
jgi:tetratricopeptide (TPR) repeat protein